MGGAVSTGENNNDLIDNLVDADYIRTFSVETVFRSVDRADYFLPASRTNAYKDLAWKSGNLHLSAPCIYSEVMEGLHLQSGLSFLNLGSGTGYLSTMVGLIIGSNAINHGIEIHDDVIQYANKKLEDFKRFSGAIDQFDFCEPKFLQGNCLCLSSDTPQYDRVYCGAGCPLAHENYMKNLLKVGGILVMPLDDQLVQVKRISETTWDVRSLLPVSFATLIQPQEEQDIISMIPIEPLSLQALCRVVVRNILRKNLEEEYPNLKSSPSTKKVTKKKRALRRLVVPFFDSSEDSSDNGEHSHRSRDLGRVNIANEESENENHTENDSNDTRDVSALIDIVLGRLRGRRNGGSQDTSDRQSNESNNLNEKNAELNEENVHICDPEAWIEDSDEEETCDVVEPNSEAENDIGMADCDVDTVEIAESSNRTECAIDSDTPPHTLPQLKEVKAIIEHPQEESAPVSAQSGNKKEEIANAIIDVINEFHRERSNTLEDEIEIDMDIEQKAPANVTVENLAETESTEKQPNKTKREKFDSGLGDEMIEKDCSSDSCDFDPAMDVESSSNSDGNQEEKRPKRGSGPQIGIISRGKIRRVVPFDSSDSEEDHVEEKVESNEIRTVSSPYTVLMKNKIQELPLPTVLKNYLNFYREF